MHHPAGPARRHAADGTRPVQGPTRTHGSSSGNTTRRSPRRIGSTRSRAERKEAFLKYYSGILFSEWMLPKCWEIARKAPEVYRAAEYIVDAGDWAVFQLTGRFVRNACAAGYKGTWNSELGFPSKDFLAALDPPFATWTTSGCKNIVAPGRRAGVVTKAFARKSGLKAGTTGQRRDDRRSQRRARDGRFGRRAALDHHGHVIVPHGAVGEAAALRRICRRRERRNYSGILRL